MSHILVPSLIVLALNDDPSHLTTPGLIPSLLPLILLVLICLSIQTSLALFIAVLRHRSPCARVVLSYGLDISRCHVTHRGLVATRPRVVLDLLASLLIFLLAFVVL
jgi:hypothetical protein